MNRLECMRVLAELVHGAFEVPDGLPWRVIQAAPSVVEAEPVRQRSSGTLFKLTSDEYDALRELIVERNPELAAAFASIEAGELPGTEGEDESTREEEATIATSPALLREETPAYGQVSPRSDAALPIRSLSCL